MKKFFSLFITLIIILGIIITPETRAQEDIFDYQEETIEGKVTQILGERQITSTVEGESHLFQNLEIFVTKGSLKSNTIPVESGDVFTGTTPKYKVGDNVIIQYTKTAEGVENFLITDYVRRNTLLLLFIFFVVVTIIIGKCQGLSSLIGMAISFLVIFKFVLPRIYVGSDPVQTAILGSIMIIPFTFLMSHGINKKTGIAIIGTLISLVFTGVLASIFVNASKLSGFASEEAGFLYSFMPGIINIKGLLLAGIIIGVLGVLDDITVSQSAIVEQLKLANPKLRAGELYKKAMAVGKDHIASMVNTLILVYTGAALPLLLLFINNPLPFSELINYEIIADEVVRTLVGSIGLMLAVPITTVIASLLNDKAK